MYVNTLNPVLLKAGPITIYWYSIPYLIGFLVIYWLLAAERKKKSIQNLTEETVEGLFFWLFLGVLVGGRIFYFLFNDPGTFIHDPLEILMIWHGGMAFFGAVFLMTLFGYYYCKNKKIPFFAVADIVVIGGALGLALGRIGNFINSEIVGIAWNGPWCVVYPAVDSLCRHPYQLYASLSHFLMLGILVLAWKKMKQRREGLLFWLFVFLYGLFRFITDFWRNETVFVFGIGGSQVASLVMVLIGLIALKKIYPSR